MILSIGCGNLPDLPEGVISGVEEIKIYDFQQYAFYYRNNYYGYIEFYKYASSVRIKAPYGIYVSSVDFDSAPEDTGSIYSRNAVLFEFGKYYFFKPDSNIFGKLVKVQENIGDTISLRFEYFIQTEKGVRDLWLLFY